MAQGDDPVDPDEILFRRIPASTGWYDPPSLAPEAFRPNKNDTTGLSIFREKYTSVESAAQGRPGKTYFVAVFRAGDLMEAGMSVSPRPLDNAPGHAEIEGLTYENRKVRKPIEWRHLLAEELCLRVEGPFES